VTLATPLSGTGSVRIADTATVKGSTTLTAATSLSGSFTLTASSLIFGTGNALSSVSLLSASGGSSIDLAGLSQSIARVQITNSSIPIKLGSATLTMTSSNGSQLLGPVSGTGGLMFVGSGSSLLNNDTNTYSGGTFIGNGGIVSINTAASLGTGPVTLDGGGISWSSTSDISSRLNPLGSGGGKFSLFFSNTTFATPLTGQGGITKLGTGNLILSVANTYAGPTAISEGTLSLGANNVIPDTSAVTVAGGANFFLPGFAETIGSLAGGGFVTLNAGTLTTGADNTSTTWSGALTGTGTFTKTGTGTLTLTGANTFTGTTTVSAGRLHLSGSATGSAFSVAPGAILSGTGSLGALTVAGTVSPGASPGTLSAGNTVFAGGGSYTWEVNNATGVSGTNYDLLSITGTLDVAATGANRFTVNLVSLLPDNSPGAVINFNPTQNYSFTFASASGGVLGFSPTDFTVNTTGFTNALAGGLWSVGQSGNLLTLNFTAASAIPEPSTYAALAGLAALALAARRRRR
jgi:autotransporter-associated beta strand protein